MSDGSIKISIEVDGKQVNVASKELDKLEESGHKSGKGIKAAEGSMDSLADSSAKAGSSVKGAGDAIGDLGDDASKASKGIKGAESSVDGLADSSVDASSSVKGVSDSLGGMSENAGEAAENAKKVKDETAGMGQETERASNNTKKFAVALGLVAVASAAFTVLKSNMDAAISRFDTLNSFPKVLEALGVSAEDSERAMSNLSDGIDGLPTKLDDIASTAQRMYSSFGDMDKATDSALALNNALLGSGANAAQAQRGAEQYLKALQTGQMDMNTWNTLQETMFVGLDQIADGFGFAGKSAKDDLYKALQDTSISMDDFNDKLIEVGTGTGIMAKLAKENSLGIATSIGNLQNAAARGIANIIDSFNQLSEEVTGKEIAEHIDGLKNVVNASFNVMGNAIERTAPIVKAFGSGVSAVIPIVDALTPAIIALATAYGSYVVITKMSAAIQTSNAVLTVAMASSKALTLATQAQMAATVASTTATRADTVAKAAQAGTIKLSTLAIGVMTGAIKVKTAAMIIGTAASNALAVAIRFLTGPIGWVVTGIGLLTGAVVGIVQWFKRSSAESKRLTAETEDLGNAMENLVDSLEGSSDAYKENQSDIRGSSKANSDLAKKIDELSQKENKSAADKALLNSYIEKLNSSVGDLNLAYEEEADAMNMSAKELQARIDLMKEQEIAQEAQSRLNEITKEQERIEEQLAETITKRKEAEDNSNLSKSEASAITEELTEQEKILKEALKELGEQHGITEEQIITATQNQAAAIEEGNLKQITSYEQLEGALKETFDNMKDRYEDLADNATNAFDRMNDESKVTADEMIANLEHNQEMTAQWGENVAELYEWAGKEGHEGFLQWLETMGPESAAELAVVSDMSEDELGRFAELMDEGAKVASDSLKTSLGEGFDEAVDEVVNFVDNSSSTLRDQIKAADFESIGIAIPKGAAGGIEKGTPEVGKASKNMADEAINESESMLGINSPSRVFKEIGTGITEGLALGINDGTSQVTQAIRKMFKAVQDDSTKSFKDITKRYEDAVKDIEKSLNKLPEITQKAMSNMLDRLKSGADPQVSVMTTLASDLTSPFNSTPSQFRSIGIDSMSGLNAGLNARRSQVMSTARSIANEVARTMKSALDINSPSRVMMGIGESTGEGFAVGVYSTIKEVERAAKALTSTAATGASFQLGAASPRVKSDEKTKRNAQKIMDIFYKFAEG